MRDYLAEIEKIPLYVFKYTKEFEHADKRRWYAELVIHGVKQYEQSEAWWYVFDSEDEILDYHQYAGCYKKVMRAQAEYERSIQGQIDMLRDEILSLENSIKRNRLYWQWAGEKATTDEFMKELQGHFEESAKMDKERITACNKKIIKLMTGRK